MGKKILGCFGSGCLVVICLVIILCALTYNWCSTTGVGILADSAHQIVTECVKDCFEPETAAAIASISSDVRDEYVNGNLSVMKTWDFLQEDSDKHLGAYGQTMLSFIYRKLMGNISGSDAPNLADPEGAETVRVICNALNNGNIKIDDIANDLDFIFKDKDNGGTTSQMTTTTNGGKSVQIGTVKHGISKEDMTKAVAAFNTLIRDKNLDLPDSDYSVDESASKAVISFLQNLKVKAK